MASGLLLALAYAALVRFWWRRGSLRGAVAVDLVVALSSLLLGLGFTVHSWLPGACVGWRLKGPAHAGWHLFSVYTRGVCHYVRPFSGPIGFLYIKENECGLVTTWPSYRR
jgi:hypothetical protein